MRTVSISFLVLLVSIQCVWAGNPNTTCMAELEKIRDRYQQMEHIQVQLDYLIYEDAQANAPSEKHQGTYLRKGKQFKLVLDNLLTIQNEQYRFVRNQQEQFALIGDTPTGVISDLAMLPLDDLLEMVGEMEQLPASEGLGLDLKLHSGIYYRMVLRYNTEFLIESIELFSKGEEDKPDQKLAIRYSEIKVDQAPSANHFSLDAYLKKSAAGFTAGPQCQGFRIIDQTAAR